MNVLVGAESSGVVREAFRANGHDAYSNDILPADDGSPYHLQGDIRAAIASRQWDLLIAHLPCTYFCNSAVWAFTRAPLNHGPGVKYGAERFKAMGEAAALWLEVANCGIPKIAMENPVAHRHALALIGQPTQSIQPYQFGDDASKRTCLWLKGLRRLIPLPRDLWVQPRLVNGKPRWGNQTDGGQNRLTPSADRWKDRARTYQGIAAAMADQWGDDADRTLAGLGECEHDWQEQQPGEPPVDVCSSCGAVRR